MSPLVFRRCLLASAALIAAWRLWTSGDADLTGVTPKTSVPVVQVAETPSGIQQR